jgi:hypothetical protein
MVLLHKAENPSEHSTGSSAKKASAASESAAFETKAASATVSPRKKINSAAGTGARLRSAGAARPILGFDHYRSSMDTVEDIERKSALGIPRGKYVETLMGCIDARHAAKTEPKLLSRSVHCCFFYRFFGFWLCCHARAFVFLCCPLFQVRSHATGQLLGPFC